MYANMIAKHSKMEVTIKVLNDRVESNNSKHCTSEISYGFHSFILMVEIVKAKWLCLISRGGRFLGDHNVIAVVQL